MTTLLDWGNNKTLPETKIKDWNKRTYDWIIEDRDETEQTAKF